MSKKEQKRRKNQRSRPTLGCPTPSKTPFATVDDAIRNLILHGYAGQGQGVYECRCGFWHRTSPSGT